MGLIPFGAECDAMSRKVPVFVLLEIMLRGGRIFRATACLAIGLQVCFADFSFAADPLIIFSNGRNSLSIDQPDIKNAAVAVLANDQSHVVVCLHDARAAELSKFMQSSAGRKTTISIGGEPQNQVRIEGGKKNGCGVLGPFRAKKARQVHQFLLGEISALPEKAAPVAGYCPEQDFIEICLRAFTGVDELEAWANANGWSWSPARFGPTLKTATVFKLDRGQFTVSEERFSDTSILSCRNLGPIPLTKSAGDYPVCDENFSKLNMVIAAPGKGAEKPPPFGGRWQQWIHDGGLWRIFVLASVLKEGMSPFFAVDKIKFRGQP